MLSGGKAEPKRLSVRAAEKKKWVAIFLQKPVPPKFVASFPGLILIPWLS